MKKLAAHERFKLSYHGAERPPFNTTKPRSVRVSVREINQCGGCGINREKHERGWWDRVTTEGIAQFFHRRCVPPVVRERHRLAFPHLYTKGISR